MASNAASISEPRPHFAKDGVFSREANSPRHAESTWNLGEVQRRLYGVANFAIVVAAASFFLVALCSVAVAIESPPLGAAKKPPVKAPLVLDDPPETLVAGRPEAERDRIEALVLFSQGRGCEQQEKYVESLRCYQRAWRLDPDSSAIARAAALMAVQLERPAEAVRYAAKILEPTEADAALLLRLGDYLTAVEDWDRAASFYKKAWAVRGKAKPAVSDVLLRLQMGRVYSLSGKKRSAADCFAWVLQAIERPTDVGFDEQSYKTLLDEGFFPYQLMGECFLDVGRPEDARRAFQKIEDKPSNKARRRLNQARVDAKAGKPGEALKTLESCPTECRMDADDALVFCKTLADVLEQLGKQRELIGRLEKLRAADPDCRVPLSFLAAKYREAGQSDKADALEQAFLESKPTRADYRDLLMACRQAGRFEAFWAVAGAMADGGTPVESLAAELQPIAADVDAARAVLEIAKDRAKKSPKKAGYGGHLAAAVLAMETKQYETAEFFFNRALAERPECEAFLVWGVGLLTADRPADSVKVFRRAIDSKAFSQDDPTILFYLAGALAMAGRFDDALAAAQTIARQEPNSARYAARSAWVLYQAKRYAEAAEAYRSLIRRFDADRAAASDETRAALREAKIILSDICTLQKNSGEAEEWLEQVLDEFPDDTGVLNDLGYLWADAGKNLRRAERMIRRAVAAEPDNAAYRDSLGLALLRTGKYAEAVAELERATADKNPTGTALEHLGDACREAGRRDRAVDAWRKAAERFRRGGEERNARAVEQKLRKAAD